MHHNALFLDGTVLGGRKHPRTSASTNHKSHCAKAANVRFSPPRHSSLQHEGRIKPGLLTRISPLVRDKHIRPWSPSAFRLSPPWLCPQTHASMLKPRISSHRPQANRCSWSATAQSARVGGGVMGPDHGRAVMWRAQSVEDLGLALCVAFQHVIDGKVGVGLSKR